MTPCHIASVPATDPNRNSPSERDFVATFVVRGDVPAHRSDLAHLKPDDTFTEPLRGFDALDALDVHGGFSWAEYLHAVETGR